MIAVAVIPARMGSSRFPGKPMAPILGMPMIGHCYLRTQMCPDLAATYVATCDQEIYEYIRSIDGNVVMTSQSHERASDRTAEAMLLVEAELGRRCDIVVMVQGDEPMVTPTMITEALYPFSRDTTVNVVNLMAPIETVAEFEDTNEIKVVVDSNSDAVYFSRAPIPSRARSGEGIAIPMLKQVCIIPFRRDYLLAFNRMKQTELEQVESIDMLRIIENGGKVRMVPTSGTSLSVDTDEDRKRVEGRMGGDPLRQAYQSNG